MLLAKGGMNRDCCQLEFGNNLPMSQLNAPVVIRAKVLVTDKCYLLATDNLSHCLCSSQLLALGASLSLAFYAQSPTPTHT